MRPCHGLILVKSLLQAVLENESTERINNGAIGVQRENIHTYLKKKVPIFSNQWVQTVVLEHPV